MKKYIVLLAIVFLFLTTGCNSGIKATYLGVTKDDITKEEVLKDEKKIFKFNINNKKVTLGIKQDEDYSILNKLVEDKEYIIEMDEDKNITSLRETINDTYAPLIQGTPGKKTVKNLLKTAMEPLGTTLYVYGGGWNVQDDGASNLSRSIGVSQTWTDFFKKMDENYSFEDYSPNYEWNKYHYLGLDCSGYIGWVVYNIMNTENLKQGYVTSSTKMADSLANTYHLGNFEKISKDNMTNEDYYLKIINSLKPGDIVSIKGHVYMVVGVCSDNSVVIINSTVTESIAGVRGGGVQLSSLAINNNKDNEANKLISSYMKKYYKDWNERYPSVVKDIDTFFNLNDEYTGIFHFDILKDKEDYLNKDAKAILKDIFED